MKSFILILCCVFSIAAYAQDDSISSVNSTVERACSKNPNSATQESCRDMVLSMASFISANAEFYADNCRGHVRNNDKETCDDAGQLIRYLDALNQ